MADKQKHPFDLVGDDPIQAFMDLMEIVEMDDDYLTPRPDDDSYAVAFVAKEATSKLVKRGKTAVLAKLLLDQPDFNVPQRIRDVLQTFAYKD